MSDVLTLLAALLRYNVTLTVAAIAIALPVSCLCAFARLSASKPLAVVMRVYVNTLRSMPLVLVMFWIYMVMPLLTGRTVPAFWSALVALALFEIAYLTEIIRSGIQSVPRAQWSAALASGLSWVQSARCVVVPQALRRMTPAILTQSLIAFQDSTIASIIGVPEILYETTIVNAREQRPIQLYVMLAAIFLVVCWTCSLTVRLVEGRLGAPSRSPAGGRVGSEDQGRDAVTSASRALS